MAGRHVQRDTQERGGKFRILVGYHIGDCPPPIKNEDGTVTKCQCEGAPKNHVYRERRHKTYRDRGQLYERDADDWEGDIIDSPVDLVARHNRGPGGIKFERVRADGTSYTQAANGPEYLPPPEPYPLEKMTYPQLLAYAEAEEIEVRNGVKKEDLIRLLRAHEEQMRKANGTQQPSAEQGKDAGAKERQPVQIAAPAGHGT